MNSRLRRPAGALLAGALVSSVFAFAPAHAVDPVGTISGIVTGTSGPLAEVNVSLYVLEDGYWTGVDLESAYTSTGSQGQYTLTVPPGNYRVGFNDYEHNYVEEFYDDAETVEDGQTIALSDGDAHVANAQLATASHIAGTVTDPSGTAIQYDASVRAYEPVDYNGYTNWEPVGPQVWTAEDGTYDLGGLTAGTYRVRFTHYSDGPALYATEYYQNKPGVLSAQDIPVGNAATVAGINAQLELDATISGTVTNASGAPIVEADVSAYVRAGDEWDYVGYATTDNTGQYAIEGLPAATYRIEFYDYPGDLSEVWNNKGSLDEGDDIVVSSNQDVTGKDAQLVAGEHDPVPFVMTAPPTISGTPQVGSPLTVTGGSWVPTPTTTEYYWFRGEDYTGVSGATYVPTAEDLGKTLSVLVQVYGPDDLYDFANTGPYGPIVAAPVVAPPVVTPAPVPAPAPAPAPVVSFSKKIDVVGALTVGSTLKLKNFQALVSRAVVSYKIQWYAGSKKIKKATKSKLKVTQALKGKKISVKVSATSGTTTKTVKVKVGKIS